MIYLSSSEIIQVHSFVLQRSGGIDGIRDLGAIASAQAQPELTFDQVELYPTIEEKAVALCYSLAMNHGFVDGNKRTACVCMETFLEQNGYELTATDIQIEEMVLKIVNRRVTREGFVQWVRDHCIEV